MATVPGNQMVSGDHRKAAKTGYSLKNLPPAPPPPPFPEGYVSPLTAETEKGTETQEAAETQAPTADPIIDQGPAKRMKF
ncbi:hypothetical protein JHK85_017688 [Glycine max]|nr:hypothetical protein JHK85_017688 [Glycine max]